MIQTRKGLFAVIIMMSFVMTSCVSKKKLTELQTDHEKEMNVANEQLGKCGEELSKSLERISQLEIDKEKMSIEMQGLNNVLAVKDDQVEVLKKQLDQQMIQVGDLTVLSQSANNNISETLQQLQKKDKYIQMVQAARTKTDSINLALAVNLKSVLENGIDDDDIEINEEEGINNENINFGNISAI